MRCYQVAPRQQLAGVINKSESETRKRKWGRRVVSRAIFSLAAGEEREVTTKLSGRDRSTITIAIRKR